MTETEDFSHLSGHKDESVRNLYNQFVIQKEKLEKYESDPTAIYNASMVKAALEIAKDLDTEGKISLKDRIALLKDHGKIVASVEAGKDAYMKEKDSTSKKQKKMLQSDNTVAAKRAE